MNQRKGVAALFAAGMAIASINLLAQTSAPSKTVDERIDELEQEIKALQQQRAPEQPAPEKKSKEIPIVSAGRSGFSFKSPDGSFVVAFHGLLQADGRFYPDEIGRASCRERGIVTLFALLTAKLELA